MPLLNRICEIPGHYSRYKIEGFVSLQPHSGKGGRQRILQSCSMSGCTTSQSTFQVQRPSSFTVSTRPLYSVASSTKTSRFLRKVSVFALFKHTIRILLVCYTLLVNLAKIQTVVQLPRVDACVDFLLRLSSLGSFITLLAETAEWWILVPLSVGVVYSSLRRDYVGTLTRYLQSISVQWSGMLFSITDTLSAWPSRRITPRPSRPRDPNLDVLTLLLHQRDHNIHPHHSDTRHHHPRSVQRS